jgi:Ca2+-transporting ATPase
MMKTIARVRRDGQAIEIDAVELVPGDVVAMAVVSVKVGLTGL